MHGDGWVERDSTNSIVITANAEKAKTLGFNENCIVHFQKQLEADIQFGHLSP